MTAAVQPNKLRALIKFGHMHKILNTPRDVSEPAPFGPLDLI